MKTKLTLSWSDWSVQFLTRVPPNCVSNRNHSALLISVPLWNNCKLKAVEANETPHSSTEKARGQPRLQKRTQHPPAITPTPQKTTALNGSWANRSQERDEERWSMTTCSLTCLSSTAQADLWFRGIPWTGWASAARTLSQKCRAPDNLCPPWRRG